MGAIAFLYGTACYAFFLATFLYAIGFVGNLLVPKSIDSGAGGDIGQALLVDLGRRYGDLRRRLPRVCVMGGCCGTDHRHIAAICEACVAPAHPLAA